MVSGVVKVGCQVLSLKRYRQVPKDESLRRDLFRMSLVSSSEFGDLCAESDDILLSG